MDLFIIIYLCSAFVLYMALSLSLIIKFLTYRTVHVPTNNIGWAFSEFADFTCDTGHCSLIKLANSGNCKLKCTATEDCECFHSSPMFPSACFLYRDCEGHMIAAPDENKHLKYYFGLRDKGPLT